MSDDGSKFSIIFSPTRKKIFEYICDNPGSHLNDIFHNVESSQGNVHHHLSELHDAGLVNKLAFNGKMIYYPSGLRDGEIETAFSQLHNSYRKSMFLHVLNNPGSSQNAVMRSVSGNKSHRLLEHLRSLVAAGLVVATPSGRNIRYTVGEVGRKIVMGSFEKVDPFITNLKEKLGHDIAVSLETRGNLDFVVIDLMNGESITIQLGKWTLMDIDEDLIIENKYMLLGDGGEKVFISLYNGCSSIDDISAITALSEVVIHAKLNTLRVMKLVVESDEDPEKFVLTDTGNKLAARMLDIKKK